MKSIITLSSLLLLTFCTTLSAQNWWKGSIRGEGPVVKKDLNLPAFDAIKLSIDADVYLKQGSTQSVTIEGQANIIDNIIIDVDNNAWVIKYDQPVRRSQGTKIYITVPTLTRLAVSGSGSIISEDTFTGLDDLEATISGSGDMRLGIEANDLETRVSGSGNIRLKGSTGSMSVRISGSGDIRAGELSAQSCTVQISGSGNCSVDVQKELQARISGSGNVVYSGSPSVRSKISGSGDVRTSY